MIDFSSHPIRLVYDLILLRGESLRFSFSRYLYRPNSIFDEREVFQVAGGELSDDWLADQLRQLKPEWELALNSVVTDSRGRRMHIGMIDFMPGADAVVARRLIQRYIGDDASLQTHLFNSGRSLHGYVMRLIKPGDFGEYLGRLLLMNQVGDSPIVDARWVGHRLMGGYCALRWSSNSRRHSDLPARVARGASSISRSAAEV
jgi:hypothetical protein